MAVKIHTEHGDECENDENPRSLLMVSFCSVDPFFGSTRAASILPSRPPNRTAAARRACQGWPRLRGHPKGLALTGPSTAACSSGSGLEATGFCVGLLGVGVSHSADEVSCRFFLCGRRCRLPIPAKDPLWACWR